MTNISEYAQAQVYAQMYRFAEVEIHALKGGEAAADKMIADIKAMAVPVETKNFMISVVGDALNRKPKYRNYLSMVSF